MGQLSALGHSEAIGGWDATKTIEALHGYRDKERNSNGMGSYMKVKMATYSDADIAELAQYIATLKK